MRFRDERKGRINQRISQFESQEIWNLINAKVTYWRFREDFEKNGRKGIVGGAKVK